MQRIEIVITNDAGESSVIASTNRVSQTITETHGEAGLAGLSTRDARAVSFLCMTTAMQLLPVDMNDPGMLKVIEAYHALGKGPLVATTASE